METGKDIRKFKIATILLSFVVIGLIIALVLTSVKVRTIVVEKDKVGEESIELKSELDSLMRQHELIKKENLVISGKLSEKDSIILANANEINVLIAKNTDYKKIKKKLDLLRNMTQGYLNQIDSLITVNHGLTTENTKYKTDITKYKETTTTLETEKKDLTEKVNTASKLKAYSVIAKAVRLKSKGTKEEVVEKASKTERIKVTFTLSENAVAAAGNKTIYCRIARPDGKILILGEDDANSFVSGGNRLQFSVQKVIKYENTAQSITLNWDIKNAKEEAIKGRYYVILYVDGYQIGDSSFDLK